MKFFTTKYHPCIENITLDHVMAVDGPMRYVNKIYESESAPERKRKIDEHLQSNGDLLEKKSTSVLEQLNDAIKRAKNVTHPPLFHGLLQLLFQKMVMFLRDRYPN